MMVRANQDIRDYIFFHGFYQWQVARELKIHETEFSRRLRTELPEEQKQRIRAIVDEMRDK